MRRCEKSTLCVVCVYVRVCMCVCVCVCVCVYHVSLCQCVVMGRGGQGVEMLEFDGKVHWPAQYTWDHFKPLFHPAT